MKISYKIVSLAASLFLGSAIHAQQYINPLVIKPQLNGNFGELRNNHFHSGIDYKTQRAVDQPVVAVAEGYIARIGVSPGGYGLALYINHPDGKTSVYAHLNRFSKKIADYVLEKQYEKQSYSITLYPEPGLLNVKKGEQIALSGNTGSSGGPHLHFEIRETATQAALDPLLFFSHTITDTRKPDIRGIAFYPVEKQGVVNKSADPLRLSIGKNKKGTPLPLTQTINAWGRIGIGVKAYDRMNGQTNIYGVRRVRLFADEKQIFESVVDKILFNQTRMLNSFVDFEEWRRKNSFFMKSFVEPGNTLNYYTAENNGFVDINEERDYRFRYELEDFHGNTLRYSFVVKGKKQPIPEAKKCANFMFWRLQNSYIDFDFSLNIPAENLYDNICYRHKRSASENYLSDIYETGDKPIPLHGKASMWIKLKTDTPANKTQYGILEISDGGKTRWLGGNYKNGGLETSVSELGKRYAIDIDSIAPVITPINPSTWVSKKKIEISITDERSGISDFRGTIDGNFALFAHDIKSTLYTYLFDDSRLEKGKEHQLVVTVTDNAGNSSEYTAGFTY